MYQWHKPDIANWPLHHFILVCQALGASSKSVYLVKRWKAFILISQIYWPWKPSILFSGWDSVKAAPICFWLFMKCSVQFSAHRSSLSLTWMIFLKMKADSPDLSRNPIHTGWSRALTCCCRSWRKTWGIFYNGGLSFLHWSIQTHEKDLNCSTCASLVWLTASDKEAIVLQSSTSSLVEAEDTGAGQK